MSLSQENCLANLKLNYIVTNLVLGTGATHSFAAILMNGSKINGLMRAQVENPA